MKISYSLPQFLRRRALLVVTGKQTAKIFVAAQHEINELDEFKIPKPHYSDLEGFSTHGPRWDQASVSGSEHEIKRQEITNPFLRELRKHVKSALKKTKVTDIYLFVPQYLSRALPKKLTPEARKLLRLEILGNFTHMSPSQLLHKLAATV